MSDTGQLRLFLASVKGELDFIKGLPSEVDLNQYITLETTATTYCMCNADFELFRGSAEEMMTQFADAVDSGKCEHCEGRPKAPQTRQEQSLLQREMYNSEYFECTLHKCKEIGGHEKLTGLNVIQIAVLFGHKDLVEWLLTERGASMHSVTKNMKEPLLNLAVIQGELDMVKLLLKNGAEVNACSIVSNYSPAVYATRFNHPEVLESLIQAGADIHVENHNESIIAAAVAADHVKCAQILLKAGVHTKGASGITLFSRSLEDSRIQMAKLLLDYINVNETFTDNQGTVNTPLFAAIQQDSLEMMKLLLQRGADPDTDIGDQHTALFYTVFQNMPEYAQVLVNGGCSVNHLNDTKYSPLHFAAWDGHTAICKILLDKGAEFDNQTNDKNTPLALACHGNHLEVIELLLPLHCNINNQDKDADTPLLYTTFNGNVKATRLLLQHGADPRMANNFGATPIWNAVHSKSVEIVKDFIECNVDVNVVSVGVNQHAHQLHVQPVFTEPKSLLYVACERLLLNVPTQLVLAGLDLSKETWAYSDALLPQVLMSLDEASPEVKAVREELCGLLYTVRSLKQASRIQLRRILGPRLQRDIRQLGLPAILEEYACDRVL